MDTQSLRNKILIGFITFDLLLLNFGLGYVIYKFSIYNFQSNSNDSIIQIPKTEYVDQCGTECKKYVDLKVAEVQSSKVAKSSPSPVPTPKVVYQAAPKTKTRTVSYVTVPGSGSTTATDWTIISGSDFYFNPADYPGLTAVYFEANMKLMTGSGMAYVRLYDSTHGIGVQGSDASTRVGTDTVVESGNISFWQGKNLIKVQIKSLTTESTVYNSGRLRIITEN